MNPVTLGTQRVRSLLPVSLVAAAAAGPAFAQGAPEPAAEDRGSGSIPSGSSGAVVKPAEPGEQIPARRPVVMPKLRHFEHAPYPAQAKQDGIEGDVILHLTIDEAGIVTQVEVVEPAGHGFDEAARQAAFKFRFEPAMVDGEPRAVTVPYRYSFTLTPAKPEQAPPPPPKVGNLVGVISIAGTDIPLVGAEVVVTAADGTEQRLVTDAQGRWELSELEPGKYRVRVAAAGYQPAENTEVLAAGEEVTATYRLAPEVEGIEVTVRGQRPPREVTRRTIERREIARIPGTSGDALRSV